MLMSPTRIFVPNGRGNPYFYNRTNGAKMGGYSDGEADGSFTLLVDNSLYFGRAGRTQGRLAEGNATGGDDRVVGFDLATGNQVWSSPVTGKALGLAVSAGKLFVSTDRGLLYAFTQRPDGKQSQFRVR